MGVFETPDFVSATFAQYLTMWLQVRFGASNCDPSHKLTISGKEKKILFELCVNGASGAPFWIVFFPPQSSHPKVHLSALNHYAKRVPVLPEGMVSDGSV